MQKEREKETRNKYRKQKERNIKKKKELREISDIFIDQILVKYFTQQPKLMLVLDKPKSSKYKKIVKEVRAKLRRVYGLFRAKEEAKTQRAKRVTKGRKVKSKKTK